MPFNMEDNLFEIPEDEKSIIENVAEATGKWRLNDKYYELIQGIVIDIRYLMLNYIGNHDADKQKLAEAIEKFILKH